MAFKRRVDKKLKKIYNDLYAGYGPQGWWPLLNLRGRGINPTKTGSLNGYHPKDYTYPKNRKQCFEICAGAILTQNTAWINAEKALLALWEKKLLSPQKIAAAPPGELGKIIRPAGYYNQKEKKLKEFSKFFIKSQDRVPGREELLNIWGIGPETADSILLYAYKRPEFVVDAYTRRILISQKIIRPNTGYEQVKNLIENNLPADFKLYQEFHALIVEYGKRQK